MSGRDAPIVVSPGKVSLDGLAPELPAFTGGAPRISLPGTAVTLPHRDRTAGFFIARMRRS